MSEHARFRDIAARALDFDIPAVDDRRLTAHLAECAECGRFAAGLRADDELARSLPRTHAPDRVRQAVVTAVAQPATAPGFARFLPVAGAAVIALMLLAGLGLVAGLRTQPAAFPVRTWTPLGSSPFSDALVTDVIGNGAQLIATGHLVVGDIPGPAIWMSPDGDLWTRMPDDAMYTGGDGDILASSSDTLVALGSSWEHAPGGAPAPQAWLTHAQRSCDSCSVPPPGNPWESPGPLFSQVSGRAVFFTAMVPGGVGFVAVGSEIPFPGQGPGALGSFAARVMTSTDGTTWTLSDPTDPELVGGSMVGVAAGPVGLVAVGDTGVAATAWFSSDGRSWTRLSGEISPATASVRGVAAGPSGFVAVGDGSSQGIAWVSADGRSWRSAPAGAPLANARMLSVRWLGSEYVATGEDTNGDGVAWHSVDGLSWSRFDTGSIFAGASVDRAVSIRSRYVLFGTDTTVPFAPFPRTIVAVGDVPGQP